MKSEAVYSWLTSFMGPILYLHFQGRRLRGRELTDHCRERFGYASWPRPSGQLLWFHAVSVGECMAAVPVIRVCKEIRPSVEILMTTSTVTAFSVLKESLPQGVLCQFAPVDTPEAVERFLTHWKPQAAVFIESELWPNLLLASAKKGILLALLNARMSPTSFSRWSSSFAKSLVSEVLSKFALIAPMNTKEAVRFQLLGANPYAIHFTGNLKYASGATQHPNTGTASFHELRKELLGRRVWLVASTHSGEENVIMLVHKKLRREFPNLLTIIVPRHPERGMEIVAAIRSEGIMVAQRSRRETILLGTELYIADTLGELGTLYRLVSVVFVGGSLLKGLQGHNLAEAAAAGCAVLTGPHIGHFSAMLDEMNKFSPLAVQQISGEHELLDVLTLLFSDGHALSVRREASLNAVTAAARGVLSKVFAVLETTVLRKAFGMVC